jgi:hypothetical protein
VLDFNEKKPIYSRLSIFRYRWVRAACALIALIVIGATVYYQTVVEPTLSATRMNLWLAGDDDHVVIEVDVAAGLVVVSGGQNGLSQLVVDQDSLFALSNEVSMEDTSAKWVEIPLVDVSGEFEAITPTRVLAALSPGAVRCSPPSRDALTILRLTVDAVDDADSGVSLCGSRVGAAADTGQDFLVQSAAILPSAVSFSPGDSVVRLDATSQPQAIIHTLNGYVDVDS